MRLPKKMMTRRAPSPFHLHCFLSSAPFVWFAGDVDGTVAFGGSWSQAHETTKGYHRPLRMAWLTKRRGLAKVLRRRRMARRASSGKAGRSEGGGRRRRGEGWGDGRWFPNYEEGVLLSS